MIMISIRTEGVGNKAGIKPKGHNPYKELVQLRARIEEYEEEFASMKEEYEELEQKYKELQMVHSGG